MSGSERLWSPQMRKWVRDADRHGLALHLKRDRRAGGAGGLGGVGVVYGRITDSGALRITDITVDVRVIDADPAPPTKPQTVLTDGHGKVLVDGNGNPLTAGPHVPLTPG